MEFNNIVQFQWKKVNILQENNLKILERFATCIDTPISKTWLFFGRDTLLQDTIMNYVQKLTIVPRIIPSTTFHCSLGFYSILSSN